MSVGCSIRSRAAAAVEPERLEHDSRGQSGSRGNASRAAPGDAAPLWRSLKGCNMGCRARRECNVNVRPLQGRPIGGGAVPGAALRSVALRYALPPAIIGQPFRLMRLRPKLPVESPRRRPPRRQTHPRPDAPRKVLDRPELPAVAGLPGTDETARTANGSGGQAAVEAHRQRVLYIGAPQRRRFQRPTTRVVIVKYL